MVLCAPRAYAMPPAPPHRSAGSLRGFLGVFTRELKLQPSMLFCCVCLAGVLPTFQKVSGMPHGQSEHETRRRAAKNGGQVRLKFSVPFELAVL